MTCGFPFIRFDEKLFLSFHSHGGSVQGHVCQRQHHSPMKTGRQSICSVTVTVLRLTEAYQPMLQLVGREDSTAAASPANANADGRDSSGACLSQLPTLRFCLAAGPQAVPFLASFEGKLSASRPVRDCLW